ncbi:apolipoprotein N-acyltransferase [bacterium]|nr:apolipoprotein N-acyltransferase [bacterium]
MTEAPVETLDLRQLVPPGRWVVLLLLTVVSGFATWAAFPPYELSGLAWVAPALLMLALSQVPPRQGFLLGWLYGTILMGGIVSFVAPYGALPWSALALAMGLFYGLFGLVGSALRTTPPLCRAVALAAAWYLVEFLRGHCGSLSLTFGDLAYSQSANLPFVQLASLCGHYGLSFTMALLSAGVSCMLSAMLPLTWLRPAVAGQAGAASLKRFNRDAGRVALACFLLMIVLYTWGRFTAEMGRTRCAEATAPPPVRVAVVQGEATTTAADRAEDTVDRYVRLSEGQPADLIVWPETAIVGPLNRFPFRQRQVGELARRKQAHMLIGAQERERDRIYNSAYFIRPDGAIAGTYRKMDLVMFGEYVPGRERFPFLKRYPIRPFDFTAGRMRALFAAPEYTLSPLICFEGIFPEQTRRICRLGAQLVVIITSDAWAIGDNEVRIHSAVGPFRAVEARKYLVRAASIGRSAIYDPYGNALAEVPCYQNGVATAVVRRVDALSVYHFWGDWPLLVVSLVALAYALSQAKRGTFIIQT